VEDYRIHNSHDDEIIRSDQEQEEEHELLLRLGSVWILELVSNNKSHPQNSQNQKATWRRATTRNDQDRIWNHSLNIMLRVHCRPTRFSSPITSTSSSSNWEKISIVFRNADFLVVNKPSGLPSHATVDNAVENALSMVKEQFNLEYAVLPQRLDTETSGLLVVATSKAFGSYLSKLLEQKTIGASVSAATTTTTTTTTALPASPPPPPNLTKRYRCLVGIEDRQTTHEYLKELQQSQSLVTHFLDESSKAPKTFVASIPILLEDDDEQQQQQQQQQQQDDDRSPQKKKPAKWLDCRLRIASVGEAVPLSPQLLLLMSSSSAMLLGQDDAVIPVVVVPQQQQQQQQQRLVQQQLVVEVEVELLTGRTHQIRGQLAAIQCPIVGDVLYGGVVSSDNSGSSSSSGSATQMALQCCAMEFAAPDKTPQGKNKNKWVPSSSTSTTTTSDSYSFSLDEAWWTRLLKEES
jgi:23S rRNA-/tRNA-specific pseudouridylate synthase